MTEVINSKMGPCKVCGEVISRQAKVCPKCGQKKPIKTHRFRNVMFVLLALTIIVNILPRPEERPLSPDELKQQAARVAEDIMKDGCHDLIRRSIRHSQTIDIYRGRSGYSYEPHEDGSAKMMQAFSAKNSFGLELEYTAICTLSVRPERT